MSKIWTPELWTCLKSKLLWVWISDTSMCLKTKLWVWISDISQNCLKSKPKTVDFETQQFLRAWNPLKLRFQTFTLDSDDSSCHQKQLKWVSEIQTSIIRICPKTRSNFPEVVRKNICKLNSRGLNRLGYFTVFIT